MKIFSAVVLIALLPVLEATAWPVSENASARELLDGAARVYSTCASYRDRGTVESVFLKESGERTVVKPFSTAFVRPGRFRYEYLSRFCVDTKCYEDWQQNVVFAHGHDVRVWLDHHGQSHARESLSSAVRALKGVSSSSSYTVPALLMPEDISGFKLTDLQGVRRLDDEVVGGADCYRIEGWDSRSRHYTIWLEKETLLIRQLFTANEIPGATVETTTTYLPEIDVEIPDDELLFDVPGA